MGRIKELLLEREYKEMELNNIQYFLIHKISSEFVGEPQERDNHYIITYDIIELNSLEQYQIKEKVLKSNINELLNGTIAKIILENEPSIREHNNYRLSYASLIRGIDYNTDSLLEYCTEPLQLFFNGIAKNKPITSWNDIIYLPSREREQARILLNINYNLETLASAISDNDSTINESLKGINSQLDLLNYVLQTR